MMTMITENRIKITDGIYKCLLLGLLIVCMSCSDNKQPQRGSDGRILKNGQFYDSQEEETCEVWICTGKRSHAYHSTGECYGIKACKGRKKRITKDKAIAMGRTPCHYCHKDLQKIQPQSRCEYVYIDRIGILHTKHNCSAIYKDHGAQAVNPARIEDLDEERLNRVCSQCVDPNIIEELREYINGSE